jgi:colanic acid/amylovoran biosynthesis protein
MTSSLHIGLLWHGDCNGNLGVGALTAGNMALVRRAAERAGVTVDFRIFQPWDPATPYISEGIVGRHFITGRYMVSPAGYWKDIGKLDLMLDIGAGDSFTDIYPDKRFAYIMGTKELCLLKGVPLVLSPQTIGPFSRQPHSLAAAHAMTKARAVFARDPLSFAAISELAPKARRDQAIDVAFALPYTPAPKGPAPGSGSMFRACCIRAAMRAPTNMA